MAEQKENPTVQPKTKKLSVLLPLILLLLIGIFYLARSVVPRVLLYLTQAANAPGNFSLTNSYVFGSPLLAEANGQDKIRVSVFLLDAKGRGVPNRQIDLSIQPKEGTVSGGLPQIKAVQATTDEFGRAVFEVVSQFPGQFSAIATVGGLEFPQKVTLTFR